VADRCLGIDVGGPKKGLDLVVLDEQRVPLDVARGAGLAEVADRIARWKPAVIAVDAPPRWGATGRSRLTERELARLNIHVFPTPSVAHSKDPIFDWMREGIQVFERCAELGYPLFNGGSFRKRSIEVFPHATAAVLAGCLPPKGTTKRVWRERVLRLQKVSTDGLGTMDAMDAALAALTGLLTLAGHASYLGDIREGVIVVPTRALAPRYRRGEMTQDGTTTKMFAWCTCGEAGCERLVPVGTEFAPGHDAKRKSRLWQEVRDGRTAEEELVKRGWKLPPEI
jgi:predicted nuclease with RNAse H fold